MRLFRLLCLCAALAAGGVDSADAPPAVPEGGFSIERFVVAAGGGTSANGAFSLSGTFAQVDAGGVLTGGALTLEGGFWSDTGAGPLVFANGFE